MNLGQFVDCLYICTNISNKSLDTLMDMYAEDNIICGPHDLLVESK